MNIQIHEALFTHLHCGTVWLFELNWLASVFPSLHKKASAQVWTVKCLRPFSSLTGGCWNALICAICGHFPNLFVYGCYFPVGKGRYAPYTWNMVHFFKVIIMYIQSSNVEVISMQENNIVQSYPWKDACRCVVTHPVVLHWCKWANSCQGNHTYLIPAMKEIKKHLDWSLQFYDLQKNKRDSFAQVFLPSVTDPPSWQLMGSCLYSQC